MQNAQPSLIAREDTLFGVCAGLGEDFGFNPLPLRMLFAVSLLVAPVAVLSTYFALGAVVLVSRLAFPRNRAKDQGQPVEAQPLQHQNDAEAAPMAIAA